MTSKLGRKSALTLGGLAPVLASVDAFAVAQAQGARQTVSGFKAETSAVRTAVSHMRSAFFAYDGAANVYLLVAATCRPRGSRRAGVPVWGSPA